MIWMIIIGLVIVLQALGFVWYGPLFGKQWGEIIGMPPRSAMTPEENKAFARSMVKVYVLNVVLTLVTVFAYVVLISVSLAHPLMYTLILFIGIIVPLEASVAMWSGKPKPVAWKMFGIMAGYQFVSFLLMGLALTFF